MVNANSISIMLLDLIIDTISDITTGAISLSHIVRELTLHEICGAAFSIPLDQIFSSVLTHEAIHSHIISIDDSSVRAWIVAIHNADSTNSVICPPQPKIITNHMARIDRKHAVRLHA
jgi:hypothetical protein